MPRLIFSGSSAPGKRDVNCPIDTASVGMPVEFLCATSGSRAAMNSSGAMIRNGRGPLTPRNGTWETLLASSERPEPGGPKPDGSRRHDRCRRWRADAIGLLRYLAGRAGARPIGAGLGSHIRRHANVVARICLPPHLPLWALGRSDGLSERAAVGTSTAAPSNAMAETAKGDPRNDSQHEQPRQSRSLDRRTRPGYPSC